MKEVEQKLNIDWNKLLFSFRRKRCVLMVGPEIHSQDMSPPLEQLSNHIAEELVKQSIEFDEKERYNLSYTSHLYLKIKHKRREDLEDLARNFLNSLLNKQKPGSPYELLASLPVRFIVSVSPDSLLKTALKESGKEPVNYHYNFNLSQESLRNENDRKFSLSKLSVNRPLLIELFGTVDDRESLVLTGENRMELIRNITKGEPRIPEEILGLFDESKTYLFFGFDFENWQFRLLLDSLHLTAETRTMTPLLENAQTRQLTAPTRTFFEDRFNFQFINEDMAVFAKKLSEKVAELGDISREQLFIVHHDDDANIRDGLERALFPLARKEGLTVWHKGKIEQGEERAKVMKENFDRSTIILILMSSSLISDPDILQNEMMWAEERHKSGLVEVMPILAKNCLWEEDPFLQNFLPLPRKEETEKPVAIDSGEWHSLNDAFTDTVFQISRKLL